MIDPPTKGGDAKQPTIASPAPIMSASSETKIAELEKKVAELMKRMAELEKKVDEHDKSKGKGKSKDPLAQHGDESKGMGKSKSATPEVGSINDIVSNKIRLFLIVGLPGSGKSTCLAKAMDNYPNMDYVEKPLKHVKFQFEGRNFIHMGSLRNDYPGTDSLPRSHQPLSQFLHGLWLDGFSGIIVAEGHRMTSTNLIADLSDHYDIFIIHLDCDTTTAAERVRLRGGRDPYSELFVTRMASCINNVKKASPAGRVLTVDVNTDDIDTVASAVKNLIRERITR